MKKRVSRQTTDDVRREKYDATRTGILARERAWEARAAVLRIMGPLARSARGPLGDRIRLAVHLADLAMLGLIPFDDSTDADFDAGSPRFVAALDALRGVERGTCPHLPANVVDLAAWKRSREEA